MVDPILGPTGQPNPFQQGSNPISPNIETGSARHALDDLMSHLEESINKQFNIREKAIKNITTGEENYWKMATRYADTFSGVLSKQHDTRMSNLRREQMAKEQAVRNEVKNEEEAQKKILNIRNEYSIKRAQSEQQHRGRLELLEKTETIFGGVQRAAGIVSPVVGNVLSEFGTLISSAATGVGLFSVAIISAAKAAQAWADRQAELSRTGAGLAAAGFGLGTTRMDVERTRKGLFGGTLEYLLSPTEQRKQLGVLGQAPALLNESIQQTEKFNNTIRILGNIMPDPADAIGFMVKNAKELGLTLDDLQNVFLVSRLGAEKMSKGQKDWNINQMDVINIYTNLQKSFRNFTTDSHTAQASLLNLSNFIARVAKGPEEQRQFTEAIGGGIANLGFSKIMGMYAFTHGGNLPNERQFNQLLQNPSGVPMMMGGFLRGILSQVTPGTPEALALKGGLKDEYFQNLPDRMIPKFNELIDVLTAPGITDKEADKKIAQFQADAAAAEQAGKDRLINSQNAFAEASNKISGVFNDIINDPSKKAAFFGRMAVEGPLVGTIHSVTEELVGGRHKK